MDWIVDVINKLLGFLYALFQALLAGLKDLLIFMFDQLMSVVRLLLDGVMASLSAIPLPNIPLLPSGVSWVLSQIGVPQMLVIVGAALLVRLMLQLIPFVRLGS